MGFKAAGGVAILLAVLCVGMAVVVETWFKDFLKAEIKQFVSVSGPDSKSYKSFRNASEVIDLYEDYYFFNVTNPDEVAYEGKPVKVTQLGPFRFKLNKYKPEANISWETDGTVRFMAQTAYIHDPVTAEEADQFNNARITSFNAGMLGVMKLINYELDQFDTDPVDGILGLVIGAMFDKCVKELKITTPFVFNVTPKMALLGAHDPLLKCLGQDDWVAAVNQPVNSSDSTALSAVYSGGEYSDTVKNPPPANKENHYQMYLGKTKFDYWGSPWANMINGTGGTQIDPGVGKVGHTVNFFIDDFLRSATFIGASKSNYLGVETVRYQIDRSSLQDGKINPNNKAFYITTTGVQPYPPSKKEPIYFGKPYYLEADTSNIKVEFVGNAATVLANPSQLDTYLDFEPHTGILFHVHKRIQGSITLAYDKSRFPFAENWTQTYAPVFWADEHMKLSEIKVNEFKGFLDAPIFISLYGTYILLGAGFFFLLVGIACCFTGRGSSSKKNERPGQLRGDGSLSSHGSIQGQYT